MRVHEVTMNNKTKVRQASLILLATGLLLIAPNFTRLFS